MVEQKGKVYIRMKNVAHTYEKQKLNIKDVAEIYSDKMIREQMEYIDLFDLSIVHKNQIIVSIFSVIDKIRTAFPSVEIEIISSNDCLVYFGKSPESQPKWLIILKVSLVAVLLFTGSALAVMNFHEDVGMHQVHSKVYKFVTGRKFENPFIIQIPYTIGIGLGMIIFFNHFSRGKIDKDQPSPLEIEVFTYEKEKDECMIDLYKNQAEQEEKQKDEDTT